MRKLPLFLAIAAIPALAQYEFDLPGQSSATQASSASESAAPAPAPAPVVFKPTASPSASAVKAPRKEGFQKPPTAAWQIGARNNPAAEAEIPHHLERPSLMDGKEFASLQVGGDTLAATVAVGGLGGTLFGDMGVNAPTDVDPDNTGGTLTRTSLGFAGAGGLYGVGLRFGFMRNSGSEDVTGPLPETNEATTVETGDGFGVFGSYQMGTAAVFGSLDMETFDQEIEGSTEAGGITFKGSLTNSDLIIRAGLRSDASPVHAFDVRMLVRMRESNQTATGTPKETFVDEGMLIGLSGSYGGKLRAGNDFALLAGVEAASQYMSFSGATGPNATDSGYLSLGLRPNMSLQYSFTEKLTGIAGADHWLLYTTEERLSDDGVTPPATKTTETVSELHDLVGGVSLGMRYDFGRLMVEATVDNNALRDGTAAFFTGNAVLARVGVVADIR